MREEHWLLDKERTMSFLRKMSRNKKESTIRCEFAVDPDGLDCNAPATSSAGPNPYCEEHFATVVYCYDELMDDSLKAILVPHPGVVPTKQTSLYHPPTS